MRSPILGEFMGTFILIVLGVGTNAGVSLTRSKSQNSGWIIITTGWGLAVLCGIFTAMLFGSADGHLNPAVTLAFAISNHDASKLLAFAAAQLAGAFLGAIVIYLVFYPHWAATPDPDTKRGVFCTNPAILHYPANLFSEFIGTFVLVLVAGAMSSKLVFSTGPASGLSPFLIGCLVWAIGIGIGGATGYAINPARDLGPRLAHAILPIPNKAPSDWTYAWIPILGPLLGAAAAGLILRALGA